MSWGLQISQPLHSSLPGKHQLVCKHFKRPGPGTGPRRSVTHLADSALENSICCQQSNTLVLACLERPSQKVFGPRKVFGRLGMVIFSNFVLASSPLYPSLLVIGLQEQLQHLNLYNMETQTRHVSKEMIFCIYVKYLGCNKRVLSKAILAYHVHTISFGVTHHCHPVVAWTCS